MFLDERGGWCAPEGRQESQVVLALEVWVAVGLVMSVLHRLGVTLYGLRGNPWRLHLEMGYPPRTATVSLGGDVGRWLWLFLVLLVGFAHPNEARSQVAEVPGGDEVRKEDVTSALVLSGGNVCVYGRDPVDDSAWQVTEGIAKVFLVISFWEILRWVCKCRPVQRKTASSQTTEEGYIPLPLPEGVPNRAEILFSLWRAGFSVTAELYPEEVQSPFYGYVGDYLRTQSRDEEVSD